MLRINDDISEGTAVGAGNNEFTNGDPALAIPATIVPAEWLNVIQEELANFIEDSGLALDDEDNNQLTQAFLAFLAAGPEASVNKIYQAIVGTGDGATHATLAAALADAGVLSGSRILVTASEALAAAIEIAKNNILIEFQPGVTLSKGAATKGLVLQGDGIRIKGGRFSGFNGGGDKAIEIEVGADYSFVTECRFSDNSTDVDDLASTTTLLANITE